MSSWQVVRLPGPWIPDAQPGMLSVSYCSGEHQEDGSWETGLNVMGTDRVMSLSVLYREAAALTLSVGRLEQLLALLIGT